MLVWICRFPLPLGVREGLQFVIVTLPGLFSYLGFCRLFIFWRFIVFVCLSLWCLVFDVDLIASVPELLNLHFNYLAQCDWPMTILQKDSYFDKSNE